MDINIHSSDKIASNKGKSLRFELELTPISERANEFSYAQLVNGISEQENNEKPSLDPLADNEGAALAKIAKRFEEKYGPGKRKRLIHESDLIDRGYGYDPSDSFVDDSELYEDYVPPQLDTKCGGFYINTGVLEFKTLEDGDNEEMDFVLKKKKLVTKKHTTHAGNVVKHKAKLVLQKAQKNTAVAAAVMQRTESLAAIAKQESLKTKDLGENFLSKNQLLHSVEPREACNIPVGIGDIAVSVPLFKASSSPSSDGMLETNSAMADIPPVGQEQEGSKSPPLLPSNLPMEIQSKISTLEESIVKEQADGKLSNKARAGYDDQFVDIEMACKKITVKERTAVFEYLSSKVGISRQTILKRVKLILRKREGGTLEGPLHRLKEAIAASMTEQLAQYEEELKNKADNTTAVEKLEQEEDSKMDDMFEDAGAPLPQEAGTPLPQDAGAPLNIDGNKPKRLPRKRYKWTEDVKKLLCEVVRLKVESEEAVNRIRISNGEELIMQFLEEKVRPLWPKGWMQKGILYKVSECAHRHFTSPQLKKSVLTAGVKCAPPSTPPSTHPSTPLSTPLIVSTATPLSAALTTPLTTPPVSIPSTLLSTSSNTPRSLSAVISNTNIKKALSTMKGGSVMTTPPTSAMTTPPACTPIVKPYDPLLRSKGGQPLSQHGLLTSSTSQQVSLLTSLSQQGSPLASLSQQGSPLASLFQQGSLLTQHGTNGSSSQTHLQTLKRPSKTTSPASQQSPATSVIPVSRQSPATTVIPVSRQSPTTTVIPDSRQSPATSVIPVSWQSPATTVIPVSRQSPAATVIPVSQQSPATTVIPVSRQSPATTVIPVSLALQLQQAGIHPSVFTSMASRLQQNSNMKSSVSNSSVASTGFLNTHSTGGVPFSLSTALQSTRSTLSCPTHTTVAHTASPGHTTVEHTASPGHTTVAHTASPGHTTVAHTASPGHTTVAHSTELSLGPSHQRLLTLSRSSGHKPMTSAGGRENPLHSTSITAGGRENPLHSTSITAGGRENPPHSTSITAGGTETPPHSTSITAGGTETPPYSTSISAGTPPHSTSISADKARQPVNGQSTSPPLTITISGGNADQ